MVTPSTAREESERIRSIVHARVLRLNASVLGVVVGLLLGVGLFLVTNFLVLRDGPGAGPHLALLGQILPGYRVSFGGSLIGFSWTFVLGFTAAFVGAKIYNLIADRRGDRPAAGEMN